MTNFDISFIGNGIISYISAVKLKKKFPRLKVSIVGPSSRKYSASIAAGAMHAAFCEVESTFYSHHRERQYFQAALESRPLWHQFLEELNLTEAVTSNSTIMYKRNKGTIFEKSNFDLACDLAKEYDVLREVSKKEIDIIFQGSLKNHDISAMRFEGEFSIDTEFLFSKLDEIVLKLGINVIDQKVLRVIKEDKKNCLTLETINNNFIKSEKVVIAAGSQSSNLLDKKYGVVPIFNAVGTAMVLNNYPEGYLNLNEVIRTPNRGGAQCGIHIVPRLKNRFYLGASNYISVEEPAHRLESIRYLIDLCEIELYGRRNIYKSKADLFIGSRAKSIDGYPLLGSLKNLSGVFIASGNYRVGLTLAPLIANEIISWHEKNKVSEKFFKWAPDRKLNSYISMKAAQDYYVESRLSNLFEHGLLDSHDSRDINSKKVELKNLSKTLNEKLVKKYNLDNDFIFDPDMYSVLL